MLFFVFVALRSALSPAAAAGAAPVAEAGLGLIAYVDDTVVLDGSGSTDAEGDPLTFTWVQVGGPPVTLDRADSDQPRFTVTDPGTLRFSLVVNDGLSDSAPDTVEVVVPYKQVEGVQAGCSTVAAGTGAPVGLLLALAAAFGRRRAR